MDQKTILESNVEELQIALTEAKVTYADLKMQHVIQPLDNPSIITSTRRTIARIATELTKKKK